MGIKHASMKTFAEKVYEIVANIPKGKVTTYSEIARAMKQPRAARAVGNALNKNRHFDTVPCHRVVRTDGHLGGYVFGLKKKIDILEKEGVKVQKEKVDLATFLHCP